MTDIDEPSVVAALGLDLNTDYAIPDDLWNAAVAVAVDPDTPSIDASTVPTMDDDGTVPDTESYGAADSAGGEHDSHTATNHDTHAGMVESSPDHDLHLSDSDHHDSTQHDDGTGGGHHDDGHPTLDHGWHD